MTIFTFFSTPITNTTNLESPLYRSFLATNEAEESIQNERINNTIAWAQNTANMIRNARAAEITDEEAIQVFVHEYEQFYAQNKEIEGLPPVSVMVDFCTSAENKKQFIEGICILLDFVATCLASPKETIKQTRIFLNILKNGEKTFSKIDPSKADFALEQLAAPFLRAIPDEKATALRKVALTYYFDVNIPQLNSLCMEYEKNKYKE